MKTLIVILALSVAGAQAGVLKVATYPVRHPKKVVRAVASVATYPVRHPVKTVF